MPYKVSWINQLGERGGSVYLISMYLDYVEFICLDMCVISHHVLRENISGGGCKFILMIP